jgi:hypothetical protein
MEKRRPLRIAVMLGASLLAATLLSGCGALHPTPYDGRESCQGVGGIYTADGRCLGGNALDLPVRRPDVNAGTA